MADKNAVGKINPDDLTTQKPLEFKDEDQKQQQLTAQQIETKKKHQEECQQVFDEIFYDIEEFSSHKDFMIVATEMTSLGIISSRLADCHRLRAIIEEKSRRLKGRKLSETSRERIVKMVDDFHATCWNTIGNFEDLISASRTASRLEPEINRPSDFSTSRAPKVKFPVITLPEFNGDLSGWLEFRDRFDSLVNRNQELSKVDKFNYLLAAIKLPSGQSSVLKNFTLSESAYDDAWTAVCERYDDKNKLKCQTIESFLNVKKMNSESSTEVRRIIDEFSTAVSSMKLLEITHEDFLVYVVQSALEEQTRKDWSKWIDNRELTWTAMKEFLTKQWKTLDSVPSDTKPTKESSKSSASSAQKSFFSPGISCHWCHEQHMMYLCPKFLAASIRDRSDFVKEKQLCRLCFSPSHNYRQCQHASARKCSSCNGMHNILLHFKTSSSSDGSPAASDRPASPNQQQTSQHSAAQQPQWPTSQALYSQRSMSSSAVQSHMQAAAKPFHPHSPANVRVEGGLSYNDVGGTSFASHVSSENFITLLQTVSVLVTDNTGETHQVRALLDSGSQHNLISEKLVSILNLQRQQTSEVLKGINGAATPVHEKVFIHLSSSYTQYATAADCFVLPRISGNLPQQTINPKQLSIPSVTVLADSSFHIPSDVDLLLGINIDNEVQLGEKIRIREGPVMHHTAFGWAISGAIRTASNSIQSSESFSHLCVTENFRKRRQSDAGKSQIKLQAIHGFYKPSQKSDSGRQFRENHFLHNEKPKACRKPSTSSTSRQSCRMRQKFVENQRHEGKQQLSANDVLHISRHHQKAKRILQSPIEEAKAIRSSQVSNFSSKKSSSNQVAIELVPEKIQRRSKSPSAGSVFCEQNEIF